MKSVRTVLVGTWERLDWDKGMVRGRMNSIFSSEIYNRWQDLRRMKYLVSSENIEKPRDDSNKTKKLALSMNILTIFVIHSGLIMLVLFVFICEHYIHRNLPIPVFILL